MAHFAEIDKNNIVIRVLVVPDEQEHRGQDYMAKDLGLGGRWIQTSYNHKIRKQYAGQGFKYDPINDVFISPQPQPWFVLDENFDWFCPPGLNPVSGKPWSDDELLLIELRDRSIDGLDFSEVMEAINV
jgi:hypothetical protein